MGITWVRIAGMGLGVLAAALAFSAAGDALVIYRVEGTNGVANPYASRVGVGIAAFTLALVVGLGAALAYRRPPLGALVMTSGSILGSVAIELFNINTWYPLCVPLCLLAAVLITRSAPRTWEALAAGWLATLLLLAATAIAYPFAGIVLGLVCGVLFLVALWVMLAQDWWLRVA